MYNKLLTIGMSTYDDFDGVYFTIQSLRMYHDLKDMEIIVLDNNSESEHGKQTKNFIEGWIGNIAKYIPIKDKPSSFNKYKIVDYANGKYVLILDCHVLLVQNSLKTLLDYYDQHPDCKDLIQGPLLYDDLINCSSEFKDEWRGDMYGIWHTNKEAYEKGEPFEIKMQGMGLCSFEKKNWPGICQYFKGFGAEEGYIAEKFRRNGGKNICIPQLKWVHRFGRPNGVKYPLALEDRIWNYFIGWLEITQDPNHYMITDTYNHFKSRIPEQRLEEILNKAKDKILK
jgi:Glycosyl transferase family 2